MISLLIPGLAQLLQGRTVGILHLIAALILWCVGLGWIVHAYSALDANTYTVGIRRGERLARTFDAKAAGYGRDNAYGKDHANEYVRRNPYGV